MCPYLDGRAPIKEITNPLGTAGRGYTQGGIHQVVRDNPYCYWTEHGRNWILSTDQDRINSRVINIGAQDSLMTILATRDDLQPKSAPRQRLNPPSGPTTRNTQVTEKTNGLVIDGIRQPSIISEQERKALIPNTYANLSTGSKDWIQSHGKVRYPTPDGYNRFINFSSFGEIFVLVGNFPNVGATNQYDGFYGGTIVVTNTYQKGGKNNAFIENKDDLTYTAIDLHRHPARDMGQRGATLKRLRELGRL